MTTNIILHHYPTSPFAEKARLMLGYKGLAWHSVHIPSLMPKPDLMPLTGGYRRTPVLQIGADIYCDTALIARWLDRCHPEPALYPAAHSATFDMAARWADSTLFSAAVSYAMQPAGVQHKFKDLAPAQIAAFVEDRKAFRKGGSGLGLPVAQAKGVLLNALAGLERQLASAPYLGGATPAIVDFSVYHCLWFVQEAGPLAAILECAPSVVDWMRRVRAIGHGAPAPMSASDALEVARAAAPMPPAAEDLRDVDDAGIGDTVRVSATDYGVEAVTGTLVMATHEEIVLARDDERVGRVHVHFPRLGYQMIKADA